MVPGWIPAALIQIKAVADGRLCCRKRGLRMAISSVIIDLSDDADGTAALAALAADRRVTLGPRIGSRQALVLDTGSSAEDTAFYESLQRMPGIRLVTLCAAWLDPEPVPAGVGAAHL